MSTLHKSSFPSFMRELCNLGATIVRPFCFVLSSGCMCHLVGSSRQRCVDGLCECDRVSGQCPCLPGVVGQHCDRCAPNTWNINSGKGCQPCQCHPDHSYTSSCDLVWTRIHLNLNHISTESQTKPFFSCVYARLSWPVSVPASLVLEAGRVRSAGNCSGAILRSSVMVSLHGFIKPAPCCAISAVE